MSADFASLATALPPTARAALWIALGAGLIATVMLVVTRKLDARNWLFARSPELPIRLLNVADDCWVRGRVRCDKPLATPHFFVPAIAYRYQLEERRTTTERTSNGGTRTTTKWVTVESLKDATDFELLQAEHSIRVHAAEADLKDLVSLGPDTVGNLRHSASILPADGSVSVLGAVAEHKGWLEKRENIPLMITTLARGEFLRRVERNENVCRWIGFVLLCLALGFAAYGVLGWLEFPHAMGSRFSLTHASLAALLGVLTFLAVWTIYSFNTLVTYRLRTQTAWKQIDVDLKNRFDLVPRLVEVVKGTVQHERELLESLARIRAAAMGDVASRIVGERRAASAVAELVIVGEKYPDLKTNGAFGELNRQLVALEEKIAHARSFFDDTATEFNTVIASFPRSIIARLCGFEEWPLFAAPGGERAAVKFEIVGGRKART